MLNMKRLCWPSVLAVAACGAPAQPDAPKSETTLKSLARFEMAFDAKSKTMKLVKFGNRTAAGLTLIDVELDGMGGTGSNDTVELETIATQFNGTCPGVGQRYCGTVTARSFYGQALGNVFVQLDSITPFAGHAVLAPDASQMGLTNTFGLWGYQALTAAGGARNRVWSFQDDGTDFRVHGEIFADLANDIGCSDGVREGFVNLITAPNIAGCTGAWGQVNGAIPGVTAAGTFTPQCARRAGDDGLLINGNGCNVSDMCAVGWHVCTNAADVASDAPGGTCANVLTGAGNTLFFATRQSGGGAGACGAGTEDIFGCGDIGAASGAGCAPLTRGTGTNCATVGAPWICSGAEATNIRKTGPLRGGVLCCRD